MKNPPKTLTLESHFGEWEEGVYVTVSFGGKLEDAHTYEIVRPLGLGAWRLEHRPDAEGRIRVGTAKVYGETIELER